MAKTSFDAFSVMQHEHDAFVERAQNAEMLEIERNKLEETRALSERLEAINTSLQEQLAAAKAESENARKDARFSKIISILSISIAFASFLVSLFLGLFL